MRTTEARAYPSARARAARCDEGAARAGGTEDLARLDQHAPARAGPLPAESGPRDGQPPTTWSATAAVDPGREISSAKLQAGLEAWLSGLKTAAERS